MKKLCILSIISGILLFVIPQTTNAQSKFSQKDSLIFKDMPISLDQIKGLIDGEAELSKQLVANEIEKKFPNQYKDINDLKQKSIDLLYKATKKRTGSEKQLAYIEKSIMSLVFAQSMYNDLVIKKK